MSTWTTQDLEHIAAADEVQVSSTRPDGTQRPAVTIWAVRLGEDVYIRSARGPEGGWFRRALAAGTGRFNVTGHSYDVTYQAPAAGDDALHTALDGAYHAKYDRYGPRIVGSVVGPVAWQATLRVDPLA